MRLKSATLRARTAAQKAESTLRRVSEAEQGLKEAEAALNTVETQLAGALDEKSFDAWRTRLTGLKRRFELERQLAEMRQQVDQKGVEAKQLSDELLSLKEKQVVLQRERSLLLKNLQLRQKIESLEEERRLLVDGEACPLCGAREHPFSEGLPAPESGDLDRTNAALEALLESMNLLTERKCSAEALVQALRPVIAQGEEERIGLPEGRPEELAEIATRIDQIEKAMARQVEVKKLVEQQRDAFSKAQLAGQAADQLAASEAEKLELAQGVLNEKSAACSVARADLLERLTPYGLVAFAEAAEQLKARRDAWVEMERQAQVLKAAIVKTEAELVGQRDLLEVQRSGCAKLAEELTAKAAELDGLRARRVALFGDSQPDEVEKGLEVALETCRSDWERAQLECSEMHQACQRVEQRIESLQRDFTESGEALRQAETAFVHRLAEAGFTDEAGWQAARLDGPALSRLEARMEGLKQQRATLSALIDDKMRQLQAEREKQFPDTSEEALHELVERCNQLQQQLGTFKSRLEQNQTALSLHQHKLAEVTKQQVECGRWNRLHELIGSADGKKFRNFAQGLTFELMVSHANRQLAKMSDRYLLIRDLEQPLDLNVVDNYQAGEIRPVKNLSGGESFIVSLSLALGLSKMASKAVRVDSLFLDEGFGTLDEDALETALEALSELKQDGKIIGVISHVEALKERIATQINVRVGSGGRSRLTGAGVSGGSVLAASA
jgi:DNA repair protein SbcC/Rad50